MKFVFSYITNKHIYDFPVQLGCVLYILRFSSAVGLCFIYLTSFQWNSVRFLQIIRFFSAVGLGFTYLTIFQYNWVRFYISYDFPVQLG